MLNILMGYITNYIPLIILGYPPVMTKRPSLGLQRPENMTRSWLDGFMHLSYHIQRLGYLYNGYKNVRMYACMHAWMDGCMYVWREGGREREREREWEILITCIYYRHILGNIHHRHIHIYTYILCHGQEQEEKAERKRFNQMDAKWPNRSEFGWGTLYSASRVLGA